jgi:hypothetical protein
MQARADLGLFQFAEVAIGRLEALEQAVFAGLASFFAARPWERVGSIKLWAQLELAKAL